MNGPGTCVPLCIAALLLSLCGLAPRCDIVFVESVARVRSLSLTGRVLLALGACSAFVVQWATLRDRCGARVTLLKPFFDDAR